MALLPVGSSERSNTLNILNMRFVSVTHDGIRWHSDCVFKMTWVARPSSMLCRQIWGFRCLTSPPWLSFRRKIFRAEQQKACLNLVYGLKMSEAYWTLGAGCDDIRRCPFLGDPCWQKHYEKARCSDLCWVERCIFSKLLGQEAHHRHGLCAAGPCHNAFVRHRLEAWWHFGTEHFSKLQRPYIVIHDGTKSPRRDLTPL